MCAAVHSVMIWLISNDVTSKVYINGHMKCPTRFLQSICLAYFINVQSISMKYNRASKSTMVQNTKTDRWVNISASITSHEMLYIRKRISYRWKSLKEMLCNPWVPPHDNGIYSTNIKLLVDPHNKLLFVVRKSLNKVNSHTNTPISATYTNSLRRETCGVQTRATTWSVDEILGNIFDTWLPRYIINAGISMKHWRLDMCKFPADI